MARLFAYAIGRPRLISRLVQFGMQSQTLMEWALRIMANLMHEDDPGAAERIYQVAARATGASLTPPPAHTTHTHSRNPGSSGSVGACHRLLSRPRGI